MLYSQTSIHTELSRVDLPKAYLLKNDTAVKIIANAKVKGQSLSYTSSTEFVFKDSRRIKATIFKNKKLQSIRNFELDSLGRVVKNSVKTKTGLGWTVSNSEALYRKEFKDLRILKRDGTLNYTMRVLYNQDGLPSEIITFSVNGNVNSRSIATYNSNENTYQYVVYNRNGKIVLDEKNSFRKDIEVKRNEYGDLIEYHYPTAKSKLTYLVEYKYDSKGNWTEMKKKKVQGKRSKVIESITRKIKYK